MVTASPGKSPKLKLAPAPPQAEPSQTFALRKGKTGKGAALSGVDLDETSGKPMGEQLREALVANAVRVIDLFKDWDEDGDGTVSKKEFRKAMPMLGLDVPRDEIDKLFDSWDPDASGFLEYKELNNLLKRRA